MEINRRQFLLLSTAILAGCRSVGDTHEAGTERWIDAGPASNYAADGLYGGFLNQGFFVIRQGDKLVALSSFCTHRHCKLEAEPDRSFYCPCHGSTFDQNGKVTEGPATVDLPTLMSRVTGDGRLLVKVTS